MLVAAHHLKMSTLYTTDVNMGDYVITIESIGTRYSISVFGAPKPGPGISYNEALSIAIKSAMTTGMGILDLMNVTVCLISDYPTNTSNSRSSISLLPRYCISQNSWIKLH